MDSALLGTKMHTQTYKVFLFHLLSSLFYFPSPAFLSVSSSFLHLLLAFCYLLFLSVQPSPWPRKVAMETEADLMQRREMNYTVRESYVCVCARV